MLRICSGLPAVVAVAVWLLGAAILERFLVVDLREHWVGIDDNDLQRTGGFVFIIRLGDDLTDAIGHDRECLALDGQDGEPSTNALGKCAVCICGRSLQVSISGFADEIAENRFPGDHSTVASVGSSISHVIEATDAHGIDSGMLRAARSVPLFGPCAARRVLPRIARDGG